jgi:hypothetical protein
MNKQTITGILSLAQCLLLLVCSLVAADDTVKFRHLTIDDQAPLNMHTKSVGDFNGDGQVDLLVAGTAGEVVWYEYPNWKKYIVASGGGGWSTDAETGDIDRDGDIDIVISDWYQNNRIVWFANPGDGRGKWEHRVIGGPRAHDIELADFDRDGDLDIVTRQQGDDGNRLEFWLQNPTGWEHQSVDCPIGEGLAVGDMDRDGDMDVAIAARWYESQADVRSGWIEHVISNKWMHNACAVRTGDLNNDGRVDVVVTPAEKRGGEYRIAWFEAPNDPTQESWAEHTIDESVESVFHSLGVADMNGDNQLDVITAEMAQGQDPDEVRVYYGNGGGLTWNKQVVAFTSSHAIRVIDVGSDGDFDIFGAKWNKSDEVDLWENLSNPESPRPDSLGHWNYIEVDSSRTERAFGLALADVTGDGYGDIASGRFFYRNPGGTMTSEWPRIKLPIDVDVLLALDIDGDAAGDLIGLDKTGKLFWLEAVNTDGQEWTAIEVGNVGETDHNISSQGYTIAQIVPGGKPEVAINVGAVYYFEIPEMPEDLDRSRGAQWRRTTITDQAYPEGISFADVDRDGDLDVAGTVDNKQIAWWQNPGDGSPNWTAHAIGSLPDKYADRFYLVDLNGDARVDLAISAANGSKNGVYWLEQPADPASPSWPLHTVVLQATTNSMDVADMDGDGDIDLISGEHRGEEKVAIWENDGRGTFTERIVSRGRESHLGTRVFDLDADGDLDIVSIAWDEYRFLHLWRNDAVAP